MIECICGHPLDVHVVNQICTDCVKYSLQEYLEDSIFSSLNKRKNGIIICKLFKRNNLKYLEECYDRIKM